ncbi:MAG: hypothetical protein ABI675_06445 [Chitinophagaceae bacterium]
MTSNKILFLLLAELIFFSCKKNDTTQIAYPSVYHKSTIKTGGTPRLFCLNGEIRNPVIISRFNLLDSANFDLYANRLLDNHYRMDSIYLRDPQHATIKDYDIPKNCLVTRKRNVFELTGLDTITGYSSADEFTRTLSYYIGQIKPEVYAEYLISSTRGVYLFEYRGREKFVLDRSGGQLAAPFIIFIKHSQQQQSTEYVNNILQEDFYKNIAAGDTILLKKYLLLYEQ